MRAVLQAIQAVWQRIKGLNFLPPAPYGPILATDSLGFATALPAPATPTSHFGDANYDLSGRHRGQQHNKATTNFIGISGTSDSTGRYAGDAQHEDNTFHVPRRRDLALTGS